MYIDKMLKWLIIEKFKRGYYLFLQGICLSKVMFFKTQIKRNRMEKIAYVLAI
jgi:hypothetical protein